MYGLVLRRKGARSLTVSCTFSDAFDALGACSIEVGCKELDADAGPAASGRPAETEMEEENGDVSLDPAAWTRATEGWVGRALESVDGAVNERAVEVARTDSDECPTAGVGGRAVVVAEERAIDGVEDRAVDGADERAAEVAEERAGM